MESRIVFGCVVGAAAAYAVFDNKLIILLLCEYRNVALAILSASLHKVCATMMMMHHMYTVAHIAPDAPEAAYYC